MASQTPIGSTKVPIALNFGTLAVGNAPGTLYPFSASVPEYRMPVGGSVIGFSANLSGTLTTGTLSFTPTKNGVAMSQQYANGTINIGTLSTSEIGQAQQPLLSFNAGDTIGLTFQKTGTIAPTTRDMNGLLLVLLDGYDY